MAYEKANCGKHGRFYHLRLFLVKCRYEKSHELPYYDWHTYDNPEQNRNIELCKKMLVLGLSELIVLKEEASYAS